MNNFMTKGAKSCRRLFESETGLKFSLESQRADRGLPLERPSPIIDGAHLPLKPSNVAQFSRNATLSVSTASLESKPKEKLAGLNATARIQCSLRITHEKTDSLQELTNDYVDAICDVLYRSRGLWEQGVFYAGDFAVQVNAQAPGSLNYTQTAIVEFELTLWQE